MIAVTYGMLMSLSEREKGEEKQTDKPFLNCISLQNEAYQRKFWGQRRLGNLGLYNEAV